MINDETSEFPGDQPFSKPRKFVNHLPKICQIKNEEKETTCELFECTLQNNLNSNTFGMLYQNKKEIVIWLSS